MQSDLQEICARVFPEARNPQVRKLTALNTGWESDIYRFDLQSGSLLERRRKPLILRIYPGEDAQEKSLREFTGMQTLHQLGYPVPRVYHLQRTHSPFSKPFLLMEFIPGEVLWPVLDRSTPEQAAHLLNRFAALLAQLHALDYRPFLSADHGTHAFDPYAAVDRFFAMIRRANDQFPGLNTFQPVMDWLADRRAQVPCPRPVPVHWDFHPANVILRPDGSLVAIDWTQIQVSDPRFDLGWTLLLAKAYTNASVSDQILTAYQQHAGVQLEQLAFFEVANAVKRLGSILISLSEGADRMGMRPEAAENMRRDFPAFQRVYDLLVSHTGLHLPEIENLIQKE